MQAMQSRVGSTETLECEDITIELQMRDLWQRFFELGTEMIITKAGRYGNNSYLNFCYLYEVNLKRD